MTFFNKLIVCICYDFTSSNKLKSLAVLFITLTFTFIFRLLAIWFFGLDLYSYTDFLFLGSLLYFVRYIVKLLLEISFFETVYCMDDSTERGLMNRASEASHRHSRSAHTPRSFDRSLDHRSGDRHSGHHSAHHSGHHSAHHSGHHSAHHSTDRHSVYNLRVHISQSNNVGNNCINGHTDGEVTSSSKKKFSKFKN